MWGVTDFPVAVSCRNILSVSHRAENQLSSPNKGLSACLLTERSLLWGTPARNKWRLSTPCRQQGLCLKTWMLTPIAFELRVWCKPLWLLTEDSPWACFAVRKPWLRYWAAPPPQTGSPEHLWGHLPCRKYPGWVWKGQDRCGVLWREYVEGFPKTLLNAETGITKLSHCRKWFLPLEALRPQVNVSSWMYTCWIHDNSSLISQLKSIYLFSHTKFLPGFYPFLFYYLSNH